MIVMKEGKFKRLFMVGVFSMGVFIFSTSGILQAGNPVFKDIISNSQKYSGKILTITGKISAIIDRTPMNIMIFDLNRTDNQTESKNSIEMSLYELTDETGCIYIVSLKKFMEGNDSKFKAKILTTSATEIDSRAVDLFDKKISAKGGFSSPDFSESTLQNLVDKIPGEEPWVLLVDVD
jgi:hypothetical protein